MQPGDRVTLIRRVPFLETRHGHLLDQDRESALVLLGGHVYRVLAADLLPGHHPDCKECHGQGYQETVGLLRLLISRRRCPRCRGTGVDDAHP